MRARFAILLPVLLAAAAPASATADDFATLVDWLTGSFSSAAQAAADTNFQDVRLEMRRIWTDRDDGAWLYVEQAMAWAVDKPYRQRVYHLRDLGDGRFTSTVFALEAPKAAVGAWRREIPLAGLGPQDLREREGCVVHLARRADGAFFGATRGRACASSLRGATWASSEITVRADGMTSWDRGWDDQGNRVWGAATGGYEFRRVTGP